MAHSEVQSSEQCEELVVLRDRSASMRCVVAIHDTRPGPAFGGIRCAKYKSFDDQMADTLRLARAMTYKCALAGIPGGGGKAVIAVTPKMNRRAAYTTLARWVENRNGRFYTGPDVGTTEKDLQIMRRHARFVIHGKVKSDAVIRATARGVLAGLNTTVRHAFGLDSPVGLTFAIQGLGAIGQAVAENLLRRGAELLLSDVDPVAVSRFASRKHVRIVSPRSIVRCRCDVFVPCALGGEISSHTLLRCRAICGAANNPLIDSAVAEVLHRQGILYAPDFVVNAGGVIHGAFAHLADSYDNDARIDGIGEMLHQIFQDSAKRGQSPHSVALELAEKRLNIASKRPMTLPKPH